ncbi:hypothetical protein GCM10009535_49580 [Streptomyces thermocarboxydovorans]|uniref:Uncharacterized protein n=1 Tax=Streptomyces thermocarboxydovorans TaxID=59298 RepID=A0ABP3SXC5_9ACTN
MSRSAGVPGAASVSAAGTAGSGTSWATATWELAIIRAAERAATDIEVRLSEAFVGEVRKGVPFVPDSGQRSWGEGSIRFVLEAAGVDRRAASAGQARAACPAGLPVGRLRRDDRQGAARRDTGKPSIRPENHPRRP